MDHLDVRLMSSTILRSTVPIFNAWNTGAHIVHAGTGGARKRTGHHAVSEQLDCDRTVIRQARNFEEHRGLRTHNEWSFWRVKSLIACALARVGVAQCGWRASFSKRARSTTPTSLRFRINYLRTARHSLAQNPLQIASFSDPICIQRFADTPKPSAAGIV